MENKEIIIDGVDVAECEDYGYRGKAGYWCHNYDEPCTDYPNCNYKQLKRKEQEREKLKQTRIEIKEIAIGIMDDDLEESSAYYDAKQILQKISECEVENAR